MNHPKITSAFYCGHTRQQIKTLLGVLFSMSKLCCLLQKEIKQPNYILSNIVQFFLLKVNKNTQSKTALHVSFKVYILPNDISMLFFFVSSSLKYVVSTQNSFGSKNRMHILFVLLNSSLMIYSQ